MKRLIKHDDVLGAKSRSVNHIVGDTCYVNDAESYDFEHFDWELNHQFSDMNTYKRWMERFDNEVD